LGIAIAVLYVVVVLMASHFLQRRGVLLVSAACIALTVLSYTLEHGASYGPPLVRCLVSLLAIAIITFLVLKSQAAVTTLREQAKLLDLTRDSVFVRDLGDVITYWNRGAEELYGWQNEEAIGKVCHELLQTIFPVPLEEMAAELLRTGRWEGELTQRKRDGSSLIVASRWSLQRDERGRPVATLETTNDITERKQAERELQLVVDTIPAFVFSVSPDGATDFLNKRWLDYTGLSFKQAQGFGWQAAYHPEDLPRLLEIRSANMAAGRPFESESRIRGADGEYRWFLNRFAPVRNKHGNIVKWYGTNTDIEDRKRAGDALRRSEAYLAEAQRLSRTGSFAWDVISGNIEWSEEAFRIFNRDRTAEPTIAVVLDRTHPEGHTTVERLIARVTQQGQDWEIEHRLLLPDGAVKHVHVVAHPIKEDAGHLEYVGALMDVTAIKRAQEALQQAQSELAHVTRVTTLGELTASIAHEINQPLAAIITNGQACLRWLRTKPPDLGEVQGAVERIIRDCHRASEVIQRLRALAKRADPQRTPVDINDVIAEVVALVQRELLSQGVKLRLDLARALTPVFGDRVQLQQVIINLVMNGIEAMAHANGPHELLIRSDQHAINQVLVAVQDSGMGLDPENVDRLFTAFFTTKPDGMGMGLSICRSIIEAHGGELRALPNDGPGATFQFTVPSHERRRYDRTLASAPRNLGHR
jgi:PAS domain S-box-containing protein